MLSVLLTIDVFGLVQAMQSKNVPFSPRHNIAVVSQFKTVFELNDSKTYWSEICFNTLLKSGWLCS